MNESSSRKVIIAHDFSPILSTNGLTLQSWVSPGFIENNLIPDREEVKVCLRRDRQTDCKNYEGLAATFELVCLIISKAADLVSAKTSTSLRPATAKIHLAMVPT